MQAATILQSHLDDMAAAIMAKDFAAYLNGVVLPLHLVTHDENMSIVTEEDLRDGFDSFCEMLRSQRTTDYIRLVDSAQLLSPDLITGRYTTHVIAGATRVFDPFVSQTSLRRAGGRWRAASITNSVARSRWPLLMPG
ncbi:hypothetical protein EEB11_06630 [Pseudotabrizicola sediminis]|uniref:SnoaL-like domain-containing protein n=1 Tax=Pseudotabrizicola sediminis TaxID=2486418 RepID=A0ABY2KS08_9RHOB|nr:hypothetical protein [Pseudotabrizicola sediminis]TGD44346.1 hypothetical protein EEB11_06630 [Pseudotabrizicola sediminis]TGD64556.1 hypothetical protein EYC08_09765 [Tabrizicola sp. WMC-M-20]